MTYLAFDIDGTVFDCNEIIVDAFQMGINRFKNQSHKKIEIPPKAKIISVIGLPTNLIFIKLFPELKDSEHVRIMDLCTQSLVEIINDGGGLLFDDVYSTFEDLYGKEYTMLVASNGRLEYIEAILNANDLMKFITKPIITLDNGIRDKTQIIKYYKDNISKKDLIIMIGDRDSDRIAASENNISFIGCAFGHAGIKEIKGSTWIANRFSDIPGRIKAIEDDYKLTKFDYQC